MKMKRVVECSLAPYYDRELKSYIGLSPSTLNGATGVLRRDAKRISRVC